MKRIGMMATYPARKESLLECLRTILPQLDVLYLYANEYELSYLVKTTKEIAQICNTCKVKIIDPEFGSGDVKDMGKFWALHSVSGYVFLLDDDFLYPPDYVSKHVFWINRHKKVSTVHGRSLKKRFPISNYFSDTKSLNWRRVLEEPKIVDIAGTGTVAFSTRDVKIKYPVSEAVMIHFMGKADIWFSCQMNRFGMDIIAIPRKQDWLKQTTQSTKTVSLYVQNRHNTSFHCKKINELEWRK